MKDVTLFLLFSKALMEMFAYFKYEHTRWCLFILLFLTCFTMYYLVIHEDAIRFPALNQIIRYENATLKEYTIFTKGCQIPYLDPWAAKGYMKAVTHKCGLRSPLVDSNQTHLIIRGAALKQYKVTEKSKFSCCYTSFSRGYSNKTTESLDFTYVQEKNCHEFKTTAQVKDEFVKVTCKLNGKSIYKDFHSFAVPKKAVQVPPSEVKTPSVVVIGVDSVSRLNFIRQMPKTRDYLISLNAIELLGYNKVGDNSFPNLIAILSGHAHDDLSFCWNKTSPLFDHCPMIWDDYHKNGYLTAFVEDMSAYGMFTYNRKGFHKQPTDYDGRIFIRANEEQIGHRGTGPVSKGSKLWGFFWGSGMTHQDMNLPPEADLMYLDILKKLKKDNILESTVVFFMSDHGIRFGSFRQTYQGRVEERLPLVFVLLPEWFKEQYPLAVSNLQSNTKMLTSQFDIHETMRDLLNLSSIKDEELRKGMEYQARPKGISLFRAIPSERTCDDAKIPSGWCTCQETEVVDIKDTRVMVAAESVVDYINKLLFSYMQCASLSLKKVLSAERVVSKFDSKSSAKRDLESYVLILTTEPGLGHFEAKVTYKKKANNYEVYKYVSRVNGLEGQGWCIDNATLTLYCYCSAKE